VYEKRFVRIGVGAEVLLAYSERLTERMVMAAADAEDGRICLLVATAHSYHQG
jgi:hypothetical protein